MIEKIVEVAKESVKKISDNIPEFGKEKKESTNIPDLISGLTTRNEKLENSEHPETKVPFLKKEIEKNGEKDTGIFPDFDEITTIELPENLYESKDSEQFKYCNEKLKEQIENDPTLKDKFTEQQIEQINAGRTPKGYTWHHSEDKGRMELVDTEIHAKTGHTGGRNIWGGGTENR